MLRILLSRPSVLRQISTSSIWNARNSYTHDDSSTLDTSEQSSSSPSPRPAQSPGLTHGHSSAGSSSSKKKPYNASIQSNLNTVKQYLRDWSDHAAITIRTRADDFSATTKTTFSLLGSRLNEVTGYEEIEALKRQVVEQEARINTSRQSAREAKVAYERAVAWRSTSQREVNDLLQRKSTWTDSDVERFTALVRQDHVFEQEEAQAKAAVNETEDTAEREFSQLMRSILARYHEEQVWSDKIRSASTYGSLAALGLNLFVFVLAIVVVEPWKRRRLAQTFEKKIEELSIENAARLDASMQEIGRQIAGQEGLILKFTQEVSQEAARKSEEERVQLKTPQEQASAEQDQTSTVVWKDWELAAVTTSAFAAGVISCLWLGR